MGLMLLISSSMLVHKWCSKSTKQQTGKITSFNWSSYRLRDQDLESMSYTSKTLRFSSSVQVILCFQMQMMCVH